MGGRRKSNGNFSEKSYTKEWGNIGDFHTGSWGETRREEDKEEIEGKLVQNGEGKVSMGSQKTVCKRKGMLQLKNCRVKKRNYREWDVELIMGKEGRRRRKAKQLRKKHFSKDIKGNKRSKWKRKTEMGWKARGGGGWGRVLAFHSWIWKCTRSHE